MRCVVVFESLASTISTSGLVWHLRFIVAQHASYPHTTGAWHEQAVVRSAYTPRIPPQLTAQTFKRFTTLGDLLQQRRVSQSSWTRITHRANATHNS